MNYCANEVIVIFQMKNYFSPLFLSDQPRRKLFYNDEVFLPLRAIIAAILPFEYLCKPQAPVF